MHPFVSLLHRRRYTECEQRCDIGVLLQHVHQFIECCRRLGTECGLIEIIEDVVYQYRHTDACQWELQDILFGFLSWFDADPAGEDGP